MVHLQEYYFCILYKAYVAYKRKHRGKYSLFVVVYLRLISHFKYRKEVLLYNDLRVVYI